MILTDILELYNFKDVRNNFDGAKRVRIIWWVDSYSNQYWMELGLDDFSSSGKAETLKLFKENFLNSEVECITVDDDGVLEIYLKL